MAALTCLLALSGCGSGPSKSAVKEVLLDSLTSGWSRGGGGSDESILRTLNKFDRSEGVAFIKGKTEINIDTIDIGEKVFNDTKYTVTGTIDGSYEYYMVSDSVIKRLEAVRQVKGLPFRTTIKQNESGKINGHSSTFLANGPLAEGADTYADEKTKSKEGDGLNAQAGQGNSVDDLNPQQIQEGYIDFLKGDIKTAEHDLSRFIENLSSMTDGKLKDDTMKAKSNTEKRLIDMKVELEEIKKTPLYQKYIESKIRNEEFDLNTFISVLSSMPDGVQKDGVNKSKVAAEGRLIELKKELEQARKAR